MRLATIDLETDPFLYGRVPCPFAAGFFDGNEYYDTWGDNAVYDMIQILAEYKEPCLIYAHNGGKFDFWYMGDWIENPVHFINTRLVKGALFHHQLRDSYAIMPVKLSALDKDEIDYAIFESDQRNKPKNKAAIRKYLESDCRYLHHHVKAFRDRFGDKLTIGSASLTELRKHHPIEHAREDFDGQFRQFYMGGRVECFKAGRQQGEFKLYDINSSYPNVMRNYQHPQGFAVSWTKYLPDSGVYFAEIVADSDGALPVRTKTGLQFPYVKNETFMACSHEIQTAHDLGILKIKRIKNVFAFERTQNFAEFVDLCMGEKIAAELAGDKSSRLFWKLIANSSYGKLGQNPGNFTDCRLFESSEQIDDANASIPDPENWWRYCGTLGDQLLAERPTQRHTYWNVSIAASITSAARAELLLGIHRAKNPIYCDTDSIICEALDMPLHKTDLGFWKREAVADEVYIGGKKLYAAYYNGQCVKAAAKGLGVKTSESKMGISPDELRNLAMGVPIIKHPIHAPALTLGKDPKFTRRTLARTV